MGAIENAVLDVLVEYIEFRNKGILASHTASRQSFDTLQQNNVRIGNDFIVYKDDVPIFRIVRRYSRKGQELMPRLVGYSPHPNLRNGG